MAIVVAGALAGASWWRWHDPALHRPFEVDELITLRDSTWAGLGPSAEPRRLRNIAEFEALPPPTPLQLAAGIYCSAGRWTEPNNHILHSLLVDAALALGARSERAVRSPALLGALAFAAAMFVLCGPVLGWRWAAPLVASWAWFHPYVAHFGVTARGYTWMLTLQVLLILLAYRLARTRRPLLLGALCASAAILSILNVVSMAVDWVLPFYLALVLVRPGPTADEPSRRIAWRRSTVAQALAVFGMGTIFLASNLAAVYSSARQYGVPFDSPGSFLGVASRLLGELFPGPLDRGLALIGALGIVTALLARDQDRFLRALIAATIGISLLHCLLSGRFPYARAAGHLIPLLLIGAAYLAESTIRLYTRRAARIAMFGMLAALSAIMPVVSKDDTLDIPALDQRIELARGADLPENPDVFTPIRIGLDYVAAFYSPPSWNVVEVVEPDQDVSIVSYNTPTIGGPGPPLVELVTTSGRTRPLGEADVSPGDWVFWYPDVARLGLDASEQRAFIRQSGLPTLEHHERIPIKMDLVSCLRCLILLPGTAPEAAEAEAVVRQAIRRFGGSAVIFSPSEAPGPRP